MKLTCCSLLLCLTLHGEDPEIVANPQRPTWSSSAQTTCYQTLEIETGSGWWSQGSTQPTLVKYGLLPNLEIRAGYTGSTQSRAYTATTTAGLQFNLGGVAVQYMHQFPASQGNFGPVWASNSVTVIYSTDAGPIHTDINAQRSYLGGPSGTQIQVGKSVSTSYTMGSLTCGCEVYTTSRAQGNASLVSNLWSLAWRVTPRWVLDVSYDRGMSRGSANTLSVGTTVNLGRI